MTTRRHGCKNLEIKEEDEWNFNPIFVSFFIVTWRNTFKRERTKRKERKKKKETRIKALMTRGNRLDAIVLGRRHRPRHFDDDDDDGERRVLHSQKQYRDQVWAKVWEGVWAHPITNRRRRRRRPSSASVVTRSSSVLAPNRRSRWDTPRLDYSPTFLTYSRWEWTRQKWENPFPSISPAQHQLLTGRNSTYTFDHLPFSGYAMTFSVAFTNGERFPIDV